MKNLFKMTLVLVAVALTMTSCDCFKKMAKKSSEVTITCTPDVLVLNNGKVVATIDAATGEITKLVISWDATGDISKVYGGKGTIAASTTVTYTNFGW